MREYLIDKALDGLNTCCDGKLASKILYNVYTYDTSAVVLLGLILPRTSANTQLCIPLLTQRNAKRVEGGELVLLALY